jgi:hypothetical protein
VDSLDASFLGASFLGATRPIARSPRTRLCSGSLWVPCSPQQIVAGTKGFLIPATSADAFVGGNVLSLQRQLCIGVLGRSASYAKQNIVRRLADRQRSSPCLSVSEWWPGLEGLDMIPATVRRCFRCEGPTPVQHTGTLSELWLSRSKALWPFNRPCRLLFQRPASLDIPPDSHVCAAS